MTEGKLNLMLARGNEPAGRYDIVARVEPIGTPQQKGFDLVLPSNQPQGKTINVAAGLYNVQLLLPNGGVLQQFCEVAADQTVPLTFHEPAAQRTGFNLQLETGRASPTEMLDRAIGARRVSTSAFETRRSRPAVPATRPAGSGAGSDSRFSLAPTAAPDEADTKSRQTQSSGRDTSRAASRRTIAAPKTALARKPASSGTRTVRRHVSIPREASLRVAPRSEPLLKLGCDEQLGGKGAWARLAKKALKPEGYDNVVPLGARAGAAIWRVEAGDAAKVEKPNRLWVKIRTGNGFEIASLPAPWRCARSTQISHVDILVDAAVGGRAATSIAIYDNILDGLLAYLDRGRVDALRPLVAQLEQNGMIDEIIYNKSDNPLAACAAAYVGLALFEPDESERWDNWLPNIMTRFSWVPDGGILHARRILLRPRSGDTPLDILQALAQSFSAGIPYYSSGLLLMREMLEMLANDHEEARTMLETVAPVAARVDQRQMFTVLRYPKS